MNRYAPLSAPFIKVLAVLLAILLCISFSGCSEYASGYSAVGLIRSNNGTSASMSFMQFEGSHSFKLKCTGEGDIHYTAKLDEGQLKVYYDFGGTKTELFSLSSGEEVDAHGGHVESGTVYIIVETDGICNNGSFEFNFD